MIQFKRGKTFNWLKQTKPLADGQPGYDKDRNKLKIGNGKDPWTDLPDASGLRMEEILVSEDDAQKQSRGLLSPLDLFKKIFLRSGKPIFTYGSEAPNEETIGQVYMQHYSVEPETDYIISSATDSNGWSYKIWKSGIAECWCRKQLRLENLGPITVEGETVPSSESSATDKTSIKLPLYHYKMLDTFDYPEFKIQDCNNPTESKIVSFSKTPAETATIQSPSIAWLTSTSLNETKKSALYSIISPYKDLDYFFISINVKGYVTIS